ncbi:MAG: hypothetical protein GY764_02190 [Halieaceae bacterium]|nr:hypothetical protein [Halieaceae bacterium]
MNFPMDNPFFQFLYWIMNTPGIGGIVVVVEATLIVIAVSLSLRWINKGADAPEKEQFAYPTSALHHYKPKRRGFGGL